MSTASVPLPGWITYGLLPFLNILTAFFISGLVVWSIGEDPFAALRLLIEGALGRGDAIGFTLFYTTSFIFTGFPSPSLSMPGFSISARKDRPILVVWVQHSWR